jgi:hypothetical protein
MKYLLKKQLRSFFDAPLSPNKIKFLNSFQYPRLSKYEFVKSQLSYISLSSVLFYTLFLILIMMSIISPNGFAKYNINMLMITSSFLPFIATLIASQLLRSSSNRMVELEMSCRFNHSDIIITRLWIHGSISLALLLSLFIIVYHVSDYSLINLVIRLFSPFVLTSFFTMLAINRLRIRETPYICGGIACFISTGNILFKSQYSLFLSNKFYFGYVLFLLTFLLFIRELWKFIKTVEVKRWNLTLID